VRDQLLLLDYSHDAIIMMDASRSITSWNSGAREIYGFTAEEAAGRRTHEFLRTRGEATPAEVDAVLARDGRWDGELTHTRRDGADVVVESRQVLIHGLAAGNGGILEINRDITARKRSEAAVLEAQKLESLGLLAGGVAHQFNNLLTSIIGNASLAMETSDPEQGRLLEEVLRSGDTAAHLTRQLLAYAGKGRFFLERIDPRELIRESVALAQPAMPKHADVVLRLAEDTPAIKADRPQAEQLVVNLVLNAGEALPEGRGTVQVCTGSREIGPDKLPAGAYGTAQPGRYFHLSVRDNGAGIADGIRGQIFDPFFSTKFVGRGLGLPAVLGIVRGHRGFLTFESRPGEGATFDVFLPAA
jgi:PAS domain S-box-containing protein